MKAIIISATSGIGEALAQSWAKRNWSLFGTYRTASPAVQDLQQNLGASLVQCDLTSKPSIQNACHFLKSYCPQWDILVFAAGVLDPIGPFEEVSFDEWEQSVQVNFIQQMRILHNLLEDRRKTFQTLTPRVIFFAGGGMNHAAINYSSYCISKIALTKMCEFLDAEIPEIHFSIVGPGWVKTKIHESTLKAGGERAGMNFNRTREKMEHSDWIPMDKVVACCTWLATTASTGVKGRNFSVAHDLFDTEILEKELEKDPDMYKLRRHKNGWKPCQ